MLNTPGEYLTGSYDQPFDEVDKPEFRALLEYIHGRPGLKIPHRSTVQRKVMELGKDTVEKTKKMIEVEFERRARSSSRPLPPYSTHRL